MGEIFHHRLRASLQAIYGRPLHVLTMEMQRPKHYVSSDAKTEAIRLRLQSAKDVFR